MCRAQLFFLHRNDPKCAVSIPKESGAVHIATSFLLVGLDSLLQKIRSYEMPRLGGIAIGTTTHQVSASFDFIPL